MQQRERRNPTHAAIRVWHENQSHRAIALNISTGGASFGNMVPLPVNACVTVQYLHLNIRARVAWTKRGMIGVSFASQLTYEQARELQGALVHGLDWRDGAFSD